MEKKSSMLLLLSAVLLIVLGSLGLLMIYMVHITKSDAQLINNAGIIRGSVQRLAKLESNNIKSDELILKIDEGMENFQGIAHHPKNAHTRLRLIFTSVDTRWNELKDAIDEYRIQSSEENKRLLLRTSEELWKYTNDAVFETQFILETKEKYFKIFFHFLGILFILILALRFIIKRYVRDQLENAVNHDPLTKVYNRHFYYESLKKEIVRAERYKKTFSLIIFDIDHFKKANDTYGHDMGDSVLKELSNICNNGIRRSDVLARIGGEEFSIIAPEADMDCAVLLAEKLRQLVEEHQFKISETITISLGVAEYSHGDSLDDLYKRADIALYKAKKSGRNRVES